MIIVTIIVNNTLVKLKPRMTMSVIILIVILVSSRDELQILVEQRTEKLQEEIRQCNRLEKELLEAGEREQRRIGHDLHDSLGQQLTATALA